MNNMNTGIRNGRICNDPEIRQAGASQVASFTLAINNKYKKNGEWVKTTAFLSCEAWGKTAETIAEYFKKGDPITIRESIKQDEWEDKNTGEKRTKLVFRVEEFWFEEGYDYKEHQWDRKSKAEGSEKVDKPAKASKAAKQEESQDATGEDNIPF